MDPQNDKRTHFEVLRAHFEVLSALNDDLILDYEDAAARAAELRRESQQLRAEAQRRRSEAGFVTRDLCGQRSVMGNPVVDVDAFFMEANADAVLE